MSQLKRGFFGLRSIHSYLQRGLFYPTEILEVRPRLRRHAGIGFRPPEVEVEVQNLWAGAVLSMPCVGANTAQYMFVHKLRV